MCSRIVFCLLIGAITNLFAADATSLIASARAAAAKNDVAGAEASFTQALQALEPSDARYSSTAAEYADILLRLKMPEKSEPVLKSALERLAQANVPPVSRVSVWESLSRVESALRNVGGVESAQLEIVNAWKTAAPDQPVLANTLIRLATTYELDKKFDLAAKALDEAVPILTKSFGPSDPSVGFAMGALSRVKSRLGERDRALELAKQAREIMAKTVDPAALSIAGGVTPPRIVTRKEPEYTDAAKKARIQGDITISLVVGEDGVPRNIHVLIPLGAGMDQKAVEAVKQWRFDPAKKNDEAVPVRATIDVSVRLF